MRAKLTALLAAAAVLAAVSAVASSGHPLAAAPHCPVFPANNPWNQRVDRLPVARNSAAIIRSVGAGTGLHPDFGTGTNGIPFTTVPGGQKKVPVRFDAADESDRGPYPIPRNAPVEGGRGADGDRHVLVVDRGHCKLYELFGARPVNGGRSWHAGSGAIWSLRSNKLRPRDWTSADAAGLPILPGLVRYDEVSRGSIDHALRFTVSRTRAAYVYPARHHTTGSNSRDLPPMGLRVRLRAGFDTSHFPRQARVLLNALKRYGMILADNGSDWYISGAPSPHWSDDALHTIGQAKGSDFEVVNTSSLPHPGR